MPHPTICICISSASHHSFLLLGSLLPGCSLDSFVCRESLVASSLSYSFSSPCAEWDDCKHCILCSLHWKQWHFLMILAVPHPCLALESIQIQLCSLPLLLSLRQLHLHIEASLAGNLSPNNILTSSLQIMRASICAPFRRNQIFNSITVAS